MLFSSPEFIFGFLPIVLIVFYLATRFAGGNLAMYALAAMSIIFYGWWNWALVILLMGSVTANYVFGLVLARWRQKVWLVAGITLNLGLLAWFKYADFFTGTINSVAGTSFDLSAIILPLAISFFTFQQIAFLVDVYQGQAGERDFGKYCLFVTFFPQLIAGPIVHHSEMLKQYADPAKIRFSYENFSIGTTIFVIGLFKKVVFADPMGNYADTVYGAAMLGTPITFITAWAGTTAFALQIYFDFSGYSDMAIGLSRMFGIKLPLNFDSPYKATNIIEFWRRWHMTLSRFLRDYLYFPLGGGRRGRPRRYANLMIVMLLGGLWHGAAWTFIAWGALHGFYLVCSHAWHAVRRYMDGVFGENKTPTFFGILAGRLLTLLAVIFAWALFRAGDWATADIMVRGLVGNAGIFLPESYHQIAPVLGSFGIQFGAGPDPEAYPTFQQLCLILLLLVFVNIFPNTQTWMARFAPALDHTTTISVRHASMLWRPSVIMGAALSGLFLIALGTSLIQSPHEFIYFQF